MQSERIQLIGIQALGARGHHLLGLEISIDRKQIAVGWKLPCWLLDALCLHPLVSSGCFSYAETDNFCRNDISLDCRSFGTADAVLRSQ